MFLSRFLPSLQATSRVPQVLLQLCSNLASFMCQNSPAVISVKNVYNGEEGGEGRGGGVE